METWLITVFFATPLVVALLVRRFGQSKDLVNILLSFSGAFLLGIAVLHVLPELYFTAGAEIGKWILLGFLVQVILEFFSKGIEHGHAHLPSSGVLPLVVLISLCLHSMLEGVPFAGADLQHVTHDHGHGHDHGADLIGLPLLMAVLLHKIPVAVALSSVLLKSAAPTSRFWFYVGLFALSFPAGVLVGSWFAPQLNTITLMLAVAMGMLLHISMTIIFESSKEHRINPKRFGAMLAGMGMALLSILS